MTGQRNVVVGLLVVVLVLTASGGHLNPSYDGGSGAGSAASQPVAQEITDPVQFEAPRPSATSAIDPGNVAGLPNLADPAVPLPSDLPPDVAVRLVVDDPVAAAAAVDAATTVGADLGAVEVVATDLFSVIEVAPDNLAEMVMLLRNAGVTTIEQDQLVSKAQTVVPTDPNWPQWWGATQAGLPSAWGVTQGSVGTVIAIVDTGVSPVTELTVAAGGVPSNRVLPGNSWVGGDARVDPDGHGTMSAVVAAGAINNSIGAGGACPQCMVMPLQTLTAEGVGSAADSAAAIVYAVDNGADVISLSLGGPGGLTAQRLAVEFATANGVPVVASAGNDGTTQMNYPAAWPDAISVAAVQQNNTLYSFSNRGSWVSVAAAGCNVSQNHLGVIRTTPSYYCGTSSSAPLVAGAVALLVGQDPAATVAQVRSRVQATSTVGVDTAWGVMNTGAMLTGVFPLPAAPPQAPTSVTTTPADGSVSLAWSAPGDDGGSPVTGYGVTGTPAGSCTTVAVNQAPPPTTCTITGLTNGVVHSFAVTAVNAVGAGPASSGVLSMPGVFERSDGVEFGLNQAFSGTLLVDPDGVFAYVGTSTNPGVVLKVRLDTMTVVGSLQLLSNQGEQSLLTGVMDPAGGFAYFGTNTSPGRVVKVDLGTFSRVGALTLPDGEVQLRSAVVDPAGGFAYFGTNTSPGRVVKVDFGTFSRVGALTLPDGEAQLFSAAMGPQGDRAYFGTFTTPGRLVAVDLESFTRAGAAVFDTSTTAYSMVVDPLGGAAYVGTYASPAQVIKVATDGLVVVGAIQLGAGENQLLSAAIAPDGRFAYFGSNTNPGGVVKIRVAADPVAPVVAGAPVSVSGSPGDGEAEVTWSPPADDGGSAITSYTVTSAPGAFTCSTLGATSCVVQGLTNGVGYTFSVVATNAVGPGPASLPSAVVTPEAPPPPPPPVVVPGTPPAPSARVIGQGSVQVTASPPLTGDPVASYLVTAVSSGATCSAMAPVTTCVVTGLAGTTTHQFVVRASNAGGSSADSAPSAEITAGVCGVVPTPFSDVGPTAYYARAASCLLERTITTNNPYKPLDPVNRAQMAGFLWRLAGEPTVEFPCGFVDGAAIPVYAQQAACWLKDEGITTIDPYKPLDPVNRAQMAGFLYRLGGVIGLWLTLED